MQLTDVELEVIKEALQQANKADKHWENIVSEWQHDSSDKAAETMQKAREAYYQEAAKLHIIISRIFREVA